MSINLKSVLFLFVGLGSILLTSCEKDDPVIPNEEELITTLKYTLTPDGGGDVVELSFQDIDGDGGDDPIIITPALAANTTYQGVITVLNESEDPAEDITEEVEEEGAEHQFFFDTDTSVSVAYGDSDADGLPIGIITTLTTKGASEGSLTIVLRHEPSKEGDNVSSGDITNAGGETDIEVVFPIQVVE